jgi:hypothetical protein
MQFGRIHGIALAILGFILIGFQAVLYLTSNQVLPEPKQPSISTTKVKTVVLPAETRLPNSV